MFTKCARIGRCAVLTLTIGLLCDSATGAKKPDGDGGKKPGCNPVQLNDTDGMYVDGWAYDVNDMGDVVGQVEEAATSERRSAYWEVSESGGPIQSQLGPLSESSTFGLSMLGMMGVGLGLMWCRCVIWRSSLMCRVLRNSTILVSLFCLVVTPALAGPFYFDDGTEQGWRWVGFYDDGDLVPIYDEFVDKPAGWFDGVNFPSPPLPPDPSDGKGSIFLGKGGGNIPFSPTNSNFVHWDLISPSLATDHHWDSWNNSGIASKFSYDVMGAAAVNHPGGDPATYVQAVVRVRLPDSSESYFTDNLFHFIPMEGQPGYRTWATHEVDVASMGIPYGSTLLDVNLRFFNAPGDGFDGFIFVDNVTAGSVVYGTDRVWGGLQTGHPSADGVGFANPANWYGYVVPGIRDRAVFQQAVAPNTFVPSGITNRQLVVNTPNADLNLTGGVYRIDALSPQSAVTVGETGYSGLLGLQNGILETRFGLSVIGNGYGQMYLYNGATWNANSILVGNTGLGILGVAADCLIEADKISIAESGQGQAMVSGTVNVTGLFEVGRYGSGTLTVENGGSVSNTSGRIGYYTGGTGTVIVADVGSTWENTKDLWLGYSSDSGVGSLIISDGGTVYVGDAASSGGPAGYLTISDTDSSGTAGGHLYVYNGSTIDNDGGAIVGYGAGEHGWATVDGAGSEWTNGGYLYVGHAGSGMLTVQNGGRVSDSATGWLGGSSGGTGTVTVTGTDSSWNIVGELVMGIYGTGILNIQNGGFVGNTNGALGMTTGTDGTVTVDGIDSRWINSGFLWVGKSGNGTLNVQAGGVLSNSDGHIGKLSGSTGEVTVTGTGSTWINSDDLFVGHYGSGTLTITDGGLVSVAETLTIDWDTDGDSFINMTTGGMLAIFGDADDSLGDFLDLIDGTDAINYWDDSMSDWADITGAMYCRDYTLEYLAEGDLSGYTLLKVQHGIDGDANGDGVVNVSDLGILATYYDTGGGHGWEHADFNGDGFVDVIDLGILATNYGNTVALAVPEPGTLALLTISWLTLFGLGALRRKR